MNKLLILLATIAIVCASDDTILFPKFQKFVRTHEKKYSSIQEFMTRYQIFKRNFQRIMGSNKSFVEDVNQFSDMTPQEFRKNYLNLNIALIPIKYNKVDYVPSENAPAAFSWLEKGAVNPVKDQKSCGSCWAFCTVGNLEGLYQIKYGKLLRFSEQQLVDCDTYDSGCNGGLMEYTFKWLIENGGLMLEDDYKYTGRDGSCKQDKKKNVVKVKSFDLLNYTDEQKIKEYLVKTGPLAVALNADPLMWYSKGIVNETAEDCDPQGLNHGVTMVGYGKEGTQEYWLIKNSWGKTWGEKGYFRIALGTGVCGINTYVTSGHLV